MVVAALAMGWPALAASAVQEQPRPLVRLDAGGHTWRLTGSVFSRKTNKVLRVPSWSGTYEMVLPTGAGERPSTSHSIPTLSATVYYFPSVERTKDVMISPTASGFKEDLKSQLEGVDEASGVQLSLSADGAGNLPGNPGAGKQVVEVRARKGSIAYSFTARPIGTDLIPFARQFLSQNNVLGEWRETDIAIDATLGDRKMHLDGSVAADEVWRGVLKLAEKDDLALDFHLTRVEFRAEQFGIERGESSPLEGARVVVDAQGDKVKGNSDDSGHVAIAVGKVSQHRAMTFEVEVPGQEVPSKGMLTLRYGRDKEKLLDAGKYQPTTAPASAATEDVSHRMLEFLKAIFHDDAGRFPRSLDHDKLGSLEYSPPPQFLHVVAWRLAKEAKDKDASRAARGCLPLDKLEASNDAASDAGDAALAGFFESLEAAIALAVETGEIGWLHAAAHKLKELAPPFKAGVPWSERVARRCLGLWRLAELERDPEGEQQARRETDALMRAIQADPEPTETVVSKAGAREVAQSGAAGPHAWAALALWKGFELAGDPGYKNAAVAQVQHLMEKHIAGGVLSYSHVQTGEHPGISRSTFLGEGAYPETAAAVHALMLTFHHTHDRTYSDAAQAVRSHVLSYWRKEFGGFGKLDYWESATAGTKDPRSDLTPIASKRQASSYQQPWALDVFLPTFYPYWGEAIKEEQPRRGLLDFLFNRKHED